MSSGNIWRSLGVRLVVSEWMVTLVYAAIFCFKSGSPTAAAVAESLFLFAPLSHAPNMLPTTTTPTAQTIWR